MWWIDVIAVLIWLPMGLAVYSYAAYPLVLRILARDRLPRGEAADSHTWPTISISVPMYNEEAQARGLIESLLALEYPPDKRQILIVSDASTDGTDAIVSEYADRGVELLRMPERGGKTRCETEAARHLRGDIIVNTDASIRIAPDALRPLVAEFADPDVGCASGRDVSVAPGRTDVNVGEGGYVGYEMWVRDLETRSGGIIGASGCFYAIRRELHMVPLPESLSRDFAAALHAHEHGYRAVSVPDAVCYVPRASGLRREYRRKVRTITRGMETLWHKRALMNPLRHGLFAWKLISHKVCRWALPWAGLTLLGALAVLALEHLIALAFLGAGLLVLAAAGVAWLLDGRGSVPKPLSVAGYLVMGNLSAAHALLRALHGDRDALWEPTRREVIETG